MKILLFITVLMIFLSGCVKLAPDNKTISECILLCKNAQSEGKDLSNGPCLSDENPNWKIENWVCDVAHSPRQPVDNQRENQCNKWWEGYQKGSPPHFVEVTPTCEFIKIG